jgi:hypothetical protein
VYFAAVVALGGGVLAGCSSGKATGPGPGVADGLLMAVQPPATVADRAVLTPAPAVQVVDVNGDPVAQAGVGVTATLTGGGTLLGVTTVSTDGTGKATFPGLSIGGLVGSKALKFTASGLGNVTTSAIQLTAGPASAISAASPMAQSVLVSTAVTSKPTVKVTDQDGNPIAGVAVTFTVTAGGGSVTGADQTTAATGLATVGSWTLGPNPGLNTLDATSGTLPGSPVTFAATGGNTVSNFTITVSFIGSTAPTASQQQAFALAAARWQQAITGDLPDVSLGASFTTDVACGGQTLSGTIDDLLILAEVKPIDGVGNILGAASPCYLRGTNQLPFIGYMKFDTADLANLESNGTLDDVILHEMGHVLGFGTLWEPTAPIWTLNFLTASSPLGFTGSNAVAAFTGLNNGTGTTVPVEETGGTGTARSHWQESTFQSEIMTGFITGVVRPLSATSIQSLKDLGYTTNEGAADPFDFQNAATVRAPGAEPAPVSLGNDVLRIPMYVVTQSNGRITGVQRAN